MKKLNNAKLKLAAGFTMLEMMIVLVILSILLGIGIYIYTQQVNNARIAEASAFIERDFVTAIMTCRQQIGTYNECAHVAGDVNSNLILTGIKSTTPWQTNWSTTVNAGTFTLRYPVNDDQTAHELAANITSTKARYLQSATNTGNVVTITVTMP